MAGQPDSLAEFERDRLGFLLDLARAKGTWAPFRLGRTPGVLVSDPTLIEEILASPKARDFSKDYLSELIPPFVRRNLLLSDPDSWYPERKLAQPAFHHDRLVEYAQVIVEESERLAAEWQDGQEVDVAQAMRRLSLQILCRTLFDLDISAGSAEVAIMIDLLLDDIDARVSRPRRRFDQLRLSDFSLLMRLARLERRLNHVIRERRGRPAHTDLLSKLAQRRDQSGRHLDESQIRFVLVPLFFAGHETTAMSLTWAFHLLGQHRPEKERLLADLANVLGKRRAAPDDLDELPFLTGVINETLRLFPPIWGFGRQATRTTSIGSHTVEEGTVLWISPWTLGRDTRWFEEPQRFHPERWAGGFAKGLPRAAFIPFGLGSRRCLGATLAIWETALVLATILRRFDVVPTESAPSLSPSFTLRPRRGLQMRAHNQTASHEQ